MPPKRSYEKYRGGAMGIVFPSNIGRGEFVARNIGLGLAISLPLTLLGMIAQQSQSLLISVVYLLLLAAFTLFTVWFSIIPRINDVGWNRKLAWLICIPFVGLFFGLALLVTPSK